MSSFFFYGTLCHLPLLHAVLGREVTARPARLSGHAVFWAEGKSFPTIVEAEGVAEGILVPDLSAADVARLDFYEAGFAYGTRKVTVETAAGPAKASVYYPERGLWQTGAPWRLDDWVARWGEVVVATAGDVMRHIGRADSATILARYPMMLVRGDARLRAQRDGGPTRLRRRAAPGDVEEDCAAEVYSNFFSVEEYDLRFRRFDGTMSPTLNRAVFMSGDAAVVLPYDPFRDRVLLIEQFRMGPYGRGDPQPWLLEAIAGRIDGAETPEDAARREAREEAGLELRDLLPASNYYPSPGAKAEFLYTYIGLANLPDGIAGIGGAQGENEDIRAHLVSFDVLMDLVASGEITAGPLVLLAHWLAARRPALREHAGGA
ncbi:NUDIX domain-containing protein [Defluviimonas sp. D31]|uniref:NUDIX domain-containing protein n=1 Tax=Defluviimonas sp. D31 TaxID=3083253 RepID=UPI00296E2F4E|nr:NUDIX domain-containing protein [Defluviimonas sp. D31]MDW4551411.1 NUDIX domain-containing protein [Defluviimonas sp. D31]